MQPIDEQLVQMCSSEIEDASIKYANGHATDFREVARIIIAALRAQADAQPAGHFFKASRLHPWVQVEADCPNGVPLYTHPAPEAAQALSDEDILAIADRHHTNCNAGLIAFVRAILTRASAAAFDDRTDTLRTALEIIAVGDAKNPRAAAERALVDAGVWTQGAATVTEPSDEVKRLARKAIERRNLETRSDEDIAETMTDFVCSDSQDELVIAAQQQAEPVGDETDALIDAAENHAALYDDDPRDCIKTDVINAFYAGAKFNVQSGQRAGVAEGWKPIDTAPEIKGDYFFCDLAWGPDEDLSTGKGFRWNGRWFVAAIFYDCMARNGRQYFFREIEVTPKYWMDRAASPTPAAQGGDGRD